MSVNLNEFTAEQLEYAISTFKLKQDDHNYHISRISKWEESEMKRERLVAVEKLFDTAILFRTQCENALQEVLAKDRTYHS